MREYTVNNIVFSIKGLTRKVFKKEKLDNFGFDFFEGFKVPDDKPFSECYMKFIKVSTDSESHKHFDDLTPAQTLSLFNQCTAETYGSAAEEKNLQGSGTSPDPSKG